jgi:Uma2 family endonuclease
MVTPQWTTDRFLAWAAGQDARYEFDGIRPVAMTGGTANHNRICQNLYGILHRKLARHPCDHYGPDMGVRTIGAKIRSPDLLITRTKFPGTETIAPAPSSSSKSSAPPPPKPTRW